MAEVKWIKLNVDLFDNPKIKYLRKQPQGDRLALIWVMLLTKAGRCNDDGRIYLTEEMPYTAKTLAQELGFSEKLMAQALETMERLGMVAFPEEGLYLPGFAEHQSLDALEKVREQTRERVARYREKKQNDASVTGNVTVTQCNGIDIEEEREEEKECVEKKTAADKPPKKKFTPPSIEDVLDYARENGLRVDGERFVNYYTSIGWKVGKNPMKDWRAAVRAWERKDSEAPEKPKDGPENHWGYVLAPAEDPWETAMREKGYDV